ncbi:MAG: TetR family transcriptional regulator [Phycisphaera sp.]|nr:TetR family transcriptional regulator [Phycisphaera sp.]
MADASRLEELFGVPPAPRTGRQRLIATAVELFYTHGFQAVGLDQVIGAAGVTKTTFYKHFESKDDLMVAAVKQRDEWEMKAWQRAVETIAGDDPRAQLLGLFDVFDRWFNDPSFRGCIFINTAAEFPNPHDPVHQAAAEHKRRNRDMARDQAAQIGLRDPEAFADQYSALVEGTLILRQVHGRNDAARVIRPAVEALIDSHTATATKAKTKKRRRVA